MRRYSIIIPVYNRPQELDELLASLVLQTFDDFEVIVVDDGSEIKCSDIVLKYTKSLDVKYFYKENEGPGETRNYGCRKAAANFFIFFDSDCLIPKDYLANLEKALQNQQFDAYGGPDAAAASFSPIQKAINYSMTSVFTTGGIRGGKNTVEKFHPRSFNMGITRKVFEITGGFSSLRYGEDIDFSIRIAKAGFKLTLLRGCFVYHKRRLDFINFFKQIFHSGSARITLFKLHPDSLKFFHVLPSIFTLYLVVCIPVSLILNSFFPTIPLIAYLAAVLVHALIKTKSLRVSILSVWATITQLFAYGSGFIHSALKFLFKF